MRIPSGHPEEKAQSSREEVTPIFTYVLNADDTPLMPCHPARARELVRKGRAYWLKRDTIRLNTQLEHAVVQDITVGIDSGAEHIGVAAVAQRAQHKPRVLFRAQTEARPMKEIKNLMDERRSYRRGRRSRQWYRQPWFSPTRYVRLSAKLYDKDGGFLYKIPLAFGRWLTHSDHGGRPQATRIGGNRFRLLTKHQPASPIRDDQPRANDILVYGVDGRLITWYDPRRGDFEGIGKRLLGESSRHKRAIAQMTEENGRTVIRLLSQSAEGKVSKDVLPNPMPPFRKFGQKRKPPGWLSPSAIALKDAHIRSIRIVADHLPIGKVRLEIAAFDTQKLNDPTIEGVGYQKPAMYAGQNRKDFVLARDGWKCVYCNASGIGDNSVPLTVDHVVPRHPKDGGGGADSVDNLVAACLKCQNDKGNLRLNEYLAGKSSKDAQRIRRYIDGLNRRNQAFYHAAHVGQIKSALSRETDALVTYGYVTKRDRIAMGLPKGHDTDAIAIAAWGKSVSNVMPPLRMYYVRRYTSGKASRRQQYKANPLGKKKIKSRGMAPALVGQGLRTRWVQQIGVNKCASIPTGETVRLRDVVTTVDGRMGYVMKINSNGTLTLSRRPVGRKGQFSASLKKISAVLRRRHGLMEDLSV